MRMRLPLRMFVSYALVIVAGVAVAYVTVRLLAPTLFNHRMAMLDGGQMGQGMGPGPGGAGFAGTHRPQGVKPVT